MTATVQKQNDSYVIRIPIYLVERFIIEESEEVYVHEEVDKIVIQKSPQLTISNDNNRRTIEELFEGYDGEYETFSIDWGKPVGKEIW